LFLAYSFADFAVKFYFFNRKVRKGMRKGRKENVQSLPVCSITPMPAGSTASATILVQ